MDETRGMIGEMKFLSAVRGWRVSKNVAVSGRVSGPPYPKSASDAQGPGFWMAGGDASER